MNTIAVLGGGPAGLLAGWAAALTGSAVAIFSERAEMSQLGGAQYLHMSIPELTDPEPDAFIEYIFRGSEPTYRRKVYGDREVPFTSFGHGPNEQPAWNLKQAYEILWDRLSGDKLNEVRITADWLDEQLSDFERVLSTVPLPSICKRPDQHRFDTQSISISTDPSVHDPILNNTILWDGTMERSWYRCSNIFGHHGTEWGASYSPPMPGLIRDRKPIGTTCDCWRDHEKVLLLGRRGTWMKGELTHHAFEGALKALLP